MSILNVDETLLLLSPFAKKWLSSPFYRITVPPEFVKSADQGHIIGNLLRTASNGTSAQVRFREDLIEPLNDQAAEALAELKSVLMGPVAKERTVSLMPAELPAQSIIMMDNGRWLHARNEVRDPNRHLRRVRWVARPFAISDSGRNI